MDRMTGTMGPRVDQRRVRTMSGRDEVRGALLGPATRTHPRAAATRLEGLALGHPQALSGVLSAELQGGSSALRLCDGLGPRERSVPYEVALHDRRRRGRRIAGLGSLRDLRQLYLVGVEP